jgi:hypothetical protein
MNRSRVSSDDYVESYSKGIAGAHCWALINPRRVTY